MAKFFVLTGTAMIVLGVLVYFSGKIPGIGKLQGDIFVKKGNFTFYFPLATCVLLSILFSVLLYFFNKK